MTSQQRVAALPVREQMAGAYCSLMKVTVYVPSCGEDGTSCMTQKLSNKATRDLKGLLSHGRSFSHA